MRSERKRWVGGLVAGLFALLIGGPISAQSTAAAKETPWVEIEAGLDQLAGGDGNAAKAAFQSAQRSDDSGLAEILSDLTEAYLANSDPSWTGGVAPWLRAHERLDAADRRFRKRPVPQAVLGEALAKIRQRLKEAPSKDSPLLRPALCNLRLLSDDRATDGEPVLEKSGTSQDVGSLTMPKGVFAPRPSFTRTAREDRVQGILVIEVTVDSEGCPASAKVLKPLPDRLGDQAISSLRWYAYEPARYQGVAVGMKFTLTVTYQVS
jgi:TonB family protein